MEHTKDLDFEAFSSDEWTIDAVLRNLTVIGEASRHVPPDVVATHSSVAWAEMRDMRNIVVHEYFGVDIQIIWTTVCKDLPAQIKPLEAILADPFLKKP